MAILTDFSPFLEPMGLDEAYVDATGFESLYGSVRQMALKIKKRVREELGLIASVGIATCKVVAKVASAESKPDGLIEVLPGQEAAYLAPLSIGKLPGVGQKTEPVLRRMDITTIGQLAGMRPEILKSRFGVFGVMLHHYANGLDNREVSPRGEASSISRETTFAQDIADRAFLSDQLRYLSEKVGADLRAAGQTSALCYHQIKVCRLLHHHSQPNLGPSHRCRPGYFSNRGRFGEQSAICGAKEGKINRYRSIRSHRDGQAVIPAG